MTEPPRDPVYLLHGLARTHRIFARLARALEDAQFASAYYRYPSRRHALPEAVRQFRAWLAERAPRGRTLHFVGFSLGALVARGALAEPPPGLALGRLVMIGAPNRGAGVLGFPGYAAAARPFFGPTVDDLREGSAALAALGTPRMEIGVIAGTGRFLAVNPSSYLNFLRGLREPHDGTVELRNTRLDAMTGFTTVPVNHTFLASHPAVVARTVEFLKTGAFAP